MDFDSDDVGNGVERIGELENENMKKVEEKRRRRQEDHEREKEKWLRNKREYSLRASRFADLKRKRREEKRKMGKNKADEQGNMCWRELGRRGRKEVIGEMTNIYRQQIWKHRDHTKKR